MSLFICNSFISILMFNMYIYIYIYMHNMYKLYIYYIYIYLQNVPLLLAYQKKKHRQNGHPPPFPSACLERSAASSRSDWKLNLSEILPWWDSKTPWENVTICRAHEIPKKTFICHYGVLFICRQKIWVKFWSFSNCGKICTWWFNSWPFWDGEFTWPELKGLSD